MKEGKWVGREASFVSDTEPPLAPVELQGRDGMARRDVQSGGKWLDPALPH